MPDKELNACHSVRMVLPDGIKIADLVSETGEIRHPFRKQGILARPGVEF